MLTQKQMFYRASRTIAEANALFLEMVKAGEMTKRDLDALIARRPEKWARFAGFRDHLSD